MTPEKALRSFTEKYSPEAIKSIDELSSDRSQAMRKFTGIELSESVSSFNNYLKGYADYKITHVGPDKVDKVGPTFLEHTKSYVENDLFKENKIFYSDASSFVSNYLQHLSDLVTVMESTMGTMIESDVENESVGAIPVIIEDYVDQITEKVEPVIDHLLWASGYNSKVALSKITSNPQKEKSYIL